MFELNIGYPTREEEEQIVRSTTGDTQGKITPVLGGEELLQLQRLVRRLPAPSESGELRSGAGAQHSARRTGSDSEGQEVRELGRRSACIAVPRARRERRVRRWTGGRCRTSPT
ncbi:hypothetical protein [Gemmatimonas sp.]|uniref:hypothetical protein n=1 Tax=Gemmatimonas sp. TaxID=1962908 RepID=UPI003DA2804A